MPNLNKSLVRELAGCEWIDKCENAIALGSWRVGKTHTALALGFSYLSERTQRRLHNGGSPST